MNVKSLILAAGILASTGAAHAATLYDVSGSFVATAVIFGSPTNVPMTVNSGTYDTGLDAGSWNVTADISAFGMGSINWNQTFTLDDGTGMGYLDQATGCTGNIIACSGIGPEFYGPIDAGGPIVAGVQAWVVTLPHFGSPTFAPTLTAAVPVPAAAWLFGSGMVGLAGAVRRRAKK